MNPEEAVDLTRDQFQSIYVKPIRELRDERTQTLLALCLLLAVAQYHQLNEGSHSYWLKRFMDQYLRGYSHHDLFSLHYHLTGYGIYRHLSTELVPDILEAVETYFKDLRTQPDLLHTFYTQWLRLHDPETGEPK